METMLSESRPQISKNTTTTGQTNEVASTCRYQRKMVVWRDDTCDLAEELAAEEPALSGESKTNE